jgi:hypothetical protein
MKGWIKEDETTYVLSEPETIPVHLIILEIQLLVQLQIELFSNPCMFLVQTISNLTKIMFTSHL